jgi:predicted small lipoprotein YifL
MQRPLQVDDYLTAVGKNQRDHGADALVVDIGVGLLVDTVAAGFDGAQNPLGPLHELRVGHYNFVMLIMARILVSTIILAGVAVDLSACGQKGALFLPAEPAATGRATLPQSLNPMRANPATGGASDALPHVPQSP